MNKLWTALVLATLLSTACSAQPRPTSKPVGAFPTDDTPPTMAAAVTPTAELTLTATIEPVFTQSANISKPTPAVVPTPVEVDYLGLPLPVERGELFSTSGACTVCHTNMTDEADADVSIDSAWRAGMMANAARDPYWQASVRSESLSSPDYQAVIEDKCATCHMPMARSTAAANDQKGQVLEDGFLNPENKLHFFGGDGVSCTLCHQVEEKNLGEVTSFSGGYQINFDLPSGERLNYGPYPVDGAQIAIMQGSSGFIPVQSEHIGASEICATCHTLYTPYIDAAGQIAGEFPEQMPYQEWLHSDYQDVRSCQDCHMPTAQGGVQLSITGGEPRSPFYQHTSAGGNVFILHLLRAFGEEIEVTASSKQYEATIERTTDQLQNRTASVAIKDLHLSGSQLTANVVIESQVGHKFPTGFPSRRAWLHITVQDADRRVVFESGATSLDGSIVGNDNDADPTKYEPHYHTINSPDQVQVYEAIMGDTEGNVTTTLLRGAEYLKDNRLLPVGFEKGTAAADIAVKGSAMNDEDFVGGRDQIQYVVDLGGAQGPFTVTVDLFFQTVGYRWADNLRQYQAPEVDRFLSYYEDVPNLPVVIASDTTEVGN